MTYGQPARTTTRRIRIRRIRVAGLLVVIAAAALGYQLLASSSSTTSSALRHLLDDKDRAYVSTDGWPLRGQGAYVLGNGRPAVSPHEQPVPIASVAKVMTAYLVLKHYPLHEGDSGRRFVVGQDDVADTETRRREGQSVLDVRRR